MASSLNSEVKNILSKLEANLETAYSQISEDTPSFDGSTFNKDNFWKNFSDATKVVSHEATKFCMIFSKPPFPTKEECQKLCDKIENSCLSLVAVFFTFPKTKGKVIHREIRHFVLVILHGMKELCTAAKNQSEAHLQVVGNVWEKCDAIEELPRDNRDAVVHLCQTEYDVVQDACQEIIDAIQNENEDDASELFIPRVNGLSAPTSSWTDSDRHVLLPCTGLIKAAKACLKKTLYAITERGDGNDERCISELDNIAEIVRTSSALVDDFVLSLYPPVNHSAAREQASLVKNNCKELLLCARNSHFCTNTDNEWLNFLEKAVDHNWVKVNDMVLAD